MSAIPVARPIPRRLKRTKSGWRLDVVRWEPIDRDVFSPNTSSIVGDDACLKQLTEILDEPTVLRDTQAILTARHDVGAEFDFVDGRWIPVVRTRESEMPKSRADASVARLEAELDALRTRVRELERLLQKRGSERASAPLDPSHDEL